MRRPPPWEAVTDDVRRLIRDMIDTMYDAEGIGLAAPQVGISKRILVVDVAEEDESRHMHALVNPVIVEFGKKTEKGERGVPEHSRNRGDGDPPRPRDRRGA